MDRFRKFLNSNAAIVIIVCGIVIAWFWDDFTEFRQNQIEKIEFPTYIEISTAIYDVSNKCILDHYADQLTEDGMIFSVDLIENDCQAKRLGVFITKVSGSDTPEEIQKTARDLYNKVIDLGGNSTFMEKAVRKSTKTGKVIQDWTDKLRNNQDKEDEPSNPTPTPRVPSFPSDKKMTV